MSEPVTFFAPGRPRTKGSGRTIPHKTTGRPIFLGANPKTKAWQGVVATAAIEAGVELVDGAPVEVEIEFLFARPKSHFRTGRNGHLLKATAPAAPIGRNVGDVDKLCRAVLDGLEGLAFSDDAQVARLAASKRWLRPDGEFAHEGAAVTVTVRRA